MMPPWKRKKQEAPKKKVTRQTRMRNGPGLAEDSDDSDEDLELAQLELAKKILDHQQKKKEERAQAKIDAKDKMKEWDAHGEEWTRHAEEWTEDAEKWTEDADEEWTEHAEELTEPSKKPSKKRGGESWSKRTLTAWRGPQPPSGLETFGASRSGPWLHCCTKIKRLDDCGCKSQACEEQVQSQASSFFACEEQVRSQASSEEGKCESCHVAPEGTRLACE